MFPYWFDARVLYEYKFSVADDEISVFPFSGLSVYCVSAVDRCELFGVRAVGSGSSRERNSVNSSGVGVLLVLRSASRYPQSQEPERHGSLVGHGQAGRLLLLVFVQAWGSPRSHLLGQDCRRACGHA